MYYKGGKLVLHLVHLNDINFLKSQNHYFSFKMQETI